MRLRELKTLAELDEAIRVADTLDGDALRNHLFNLSLSMGGLNGDPLSAEYLQKVSEQYEAVAGRAYGFANEHTPIDFDSVVVRPFPYFTNSLGIVSEYFLHFFYLMKHLGIREGARVADMGPGWGNSTEILAKQGFDVYAVDVNADFCRLIDERLKRQGLKANVVVGDFFQAENLPEMDAYVFFESFHHCLQHQDLLRLLHRKTGPDAVLIFGAEPIYQDWVYPWGIRPDGMALWSVRKFGWLELGFKEAYFIDVLRETGWFVEKITLPGQLAPLYRATKKAIIKPGTMELPDNAGWGPQETAPGAEYRFTSDRTTVDAVGRTAKVDLQNFRPLPLVASVNGVECRLEPGERQTVTVDDAFDQLVIRSEIWSPRNEIGNSDSRILGVAVRSIQFD